MHSNQWSNAKVVKTYPGRDGVVRAVDVQVEHRILPEKYDSKKNFIQQIETRTAIYRRPVAKLAMLLSMDEIPEGCKIPSEDLPSEVSPRQDFSPPPRC